MKNGKSLVELAQELERQSQAKKDFVASTEVMEMTPGGQLILDNSSSDDTYDFSLTEVAHTQISQRLNIPLKYYKRMREDAPELLAQNVNTWFQHQPERRMIRTLDDKARAFLSDRYRRLDNYELAEVVLPVLCELGDGVKIVSSELTEKRMYIKAINQRLELEVKPGDVVQAGVCISNSEMGATRNSCFSLHAIASWLRGVSASLLASASGRTGAEEKKNRIISKKKVFSSQVRKNSLRSYLT